MSPETSSHSSDSVAGVHRPQPRLAHAQGSESSSRMTTKVLEPHDRGDLLVGAVFDAFNKIYESRVEDLRRIATRGSGILPHGTLRPDLIDRFTREASLSARHVLEMCIRALDYSLMSAHATRRRAPARRGPLPCSLRRRQSTRSPARPVGAAPGRMRAAKDEGSLQRPGRRQYNGCAPPASMRGIPARGSALLPSHASSACSLRLPPQPGS